MADYQLDVLVPTHQKLELTIKCLETLYAHTSAPFHLIIVDDSTDLTPLYLSQIEKEHDNVTYIHSDVPYKSGNQFFNIGFEKCETPYVATVMNSIRVEPEWEVQALEIMRLYKDVGIIGFKCLFPDGKIESAGIHIADARIVDNGKFASISTHCPIDIGRDFPGHQRCLSQEVMAIQWAFALLRLEAVKGILDPDLFNGFKGWDDIDNCFAVKKAGWRIMYCGSGAGYHEPRATRGDNSEEAARLNLENAKIFFKRWGYLKEDVK